MSIDLDQARAFVLAHGDAVEQARLQYIWSGEPVPGAMVDALLVGQRADGGWSPFWAPDYSGLDATCFRLAQADQMGIPATDPRIQQAIRFLAHRQHADGSWEEDESVRDLAPPWAVPGDPVAHLYLTANCGFWLAVAASAPADAALAAACLQEHLGKDGHLPGFLHAHWLAAGLWIAVGEQEAADRALAYLATRLNYDTPASNLSWLLTTLDRAGLPSDHPLITQAIELLILCQFTDGHWNSEDGPEQDVHVTLEAIRAFVNFNESKNELKIVPPPADPLWTGPIPAENWLQVEGEIGIQFPQDYKDFIARYSSRNGIYIGGFFLILDPFAPYGNLKRAIADFLDPLRSLRQKYGEQEYPYPLYPEPDGLLPWGSTENGDDLFWLTIGAPDQWPIVIKASRQPEFEQHPGPMTRFLDGILTGAITSEIISRKMIAPARLL